MLNTKTIHGLMLQSLVKEHLELAWIFNCVARMGWMQRMTQFKDKTSKREGKFISAGLFTYPALQAADVLLLNNTILPNFGTLIRWRAHRHVLRQSVGWFENDFAGRIANRIMQAPPAAGEPAASVAAVGTSERERSSQPIFSRTNAFETRRFCLSVSVVEFEIKKGGHPKRMSTHKTVSPLQLSSRPSVSANRQVPAGGRSHPPCSAGT